MAELTDEGRKARRVKVKRAYTAMNTHGAEIALRSERIFGLVQSELRYKQNLYRITEKLVGASIGDATAIDQPAYARRLAACQREVAILRRRINSERQSIRLAEKALAKHAAEIEHLLDGLAGETTQQRLRALEAKRLNCRQRVAKAINFSSAFYDGAVEVDLHRQHSK
jgi:hypothetical protein